MKITKTKLLDKLKEHDVLYSTLNHEAFFTVEDSKKLRSSIAGAHTKNLFLKNKKNKFYLISCLEDRSINLKKLSKSLGIGNVSFANEKHLYEYLGVTPGSVTPYGLLNDIKKNVIFYLDNEIIEIGKVSFHPLENTSTITTTAVDFINFLVENNIKVNIYDFKQEVVINS